MRQHHVTFCSPGTLFDEQTTELIQEWDVQVATLRAEAIVERYNARPFGFFFTTVITAAPVPDGEGSTLEVLPREVARSGMHYLGGKIVTIDEIQAQNDGGDEILLWNMQRNNIPIVIVVENGFKITRAFGEWDVVVDATGTIVERGDTAERKAYRAAKAAKNER